MAEQLSIEELVKAEQALREQYVDARQNKQFKLMVGRFGKKISRDE